MRDLRFLGKQMARPGRRMALFLATMLPAMMLATAAFAEPGSTSAGDITAYATKVGDNSNVIIEIINYIAFVSGIVLVALGISEMRKVADGTAGGSVAWRHPLTKLGFGGMMMAVPYLTDVVAGTMSSEDSSPFQFFKMNAYTFGDGQTKAGAVSGLMANSINQAGVLVSVAAYIAFIIGVFFTVRGIQMLRAHIDNPGQTPVADALKRLAVGGALFSFPVLVNIIYKTFGSGGSALSNTGWSSTDGTAGGLDGMMISFIKDISTPALFSIEMFCYIAGVMMVLFAMQRMVRTAQDGPRGPLGFGTIVMFIVAGCLLSFPQIMAVVAQSIFGAADARTNVSFMSGTGVDEAQLANARNVFSAVLAFMAVIGFLSVVRGLFLLKGFADGSQQATMMSVVTHIVAGALCVNLGGLLNAIQTSLNIQAFPVTFN